MKTLVLALSFLTTIPLFPVGYVSDEEMGQSSAFFPLVGFVVGGINATMYFLGLYFWSPAVAAWLWLIANALITGGLHLDGWMDTFDALGSRKSQSEMLAIMKDSRIGAMGGMAVVLLLGFKWSLLVAAGATPALVLLAPVVGRSAVLIATQVFTYIRAGGLGHTFTQPLPPARWLFVLVSILLPLSVLGSMQGLLAALLAVSLAMLWARSLCHKFWGLTGDTYGAINEATEVLFLFFALARFAP